MKVKPGHQRFNTPIEVGTVSNVNTNDDKSVDEQIDTYLSDRRKRLLDEVKLAELEHVAEDEKTGAERSRRERELLVGGKIGPRGQEEDMEGTEKKIKDAAEVAAEAASAGVNPEDATALGTGKAKVVVIKPGGDGGSGPTDEGKGGWSVVDGKPVKDPEGEYTFNQALKVVGAEKAKGSNDPLAVFKWMQEQGLLTGSKGDDYMSKFMGELAHRSVESIVGNKSGSSSADAIEALRLETATLRQELRIATDPIESAKRVSTLYDSLKAAGIIPEPRTSGTSTDDLKEEHRHEERMDEIRAGREHNERLTDLASSIPERVGQGIGEDIRRGRGKGGPKGNPSSSNLPRFTCEECHKEFLISPEAEKLGILTCPYCGMTYRSESEREHGEQEKTPSID